MFNYTDIAFWTMVIGGLGLFLYGISSISKVLKKMAGKKLRKAIDKCSNNKFMGLLVGTGFTAIIQSSSGTSALTIGLVRAGVMTMIQACAIIIGANIGTTVTAFIVSIPLTEYLPVFVFIGAFILLLVSRRKWENIGELIFAFGCIFFGLWIMELNLETLAEIEGFTDFFVFLSDNPWLGLLMGAVITVCLQSSSAVIGVLQGIYAASILAFTNGDSTTAISLFGLLPIIFGANIGTTSTAILSAIGGSKEAKRVAFFHVFYNVSGALIFMGIIYILRDWLLTSYTWAIEPKVQLALCHLVFNVGTAVIFFPLIKPIAKLSTKVIPGDDKFTSFIAIKELDSNVMKSFPSEGIALAKDQVLAMFGYTKLMFESIRLYLDKWNSEDCALVHQIEAGVDRIDRQLNDYLLSADKGELSTSDMTNFSRVLRACKDIERIGDYGENLIDFFENANERKDKPVDKVKATIEAANDASLSLINETISAFKNDDSALALDVIKTRRDINAKLDVSISEHFDGMTSGKRGAKYLDLIFVDIINCYQRVNSHCSNIGKLFGTDKAYAFTKEEEERFSSMADRY